MSWELVVLVPLAVGALVATLSFVGCTWPRRPRPDVELDPGSVGGITAVRFLVSVPGRPLATADGTFAMSPNRWYAGLQMPPDGDWTIACEVQRSNQPLARTAEVTRRVPPRPVRLRLVDEAGGLRLESGAPPPPMRVPVVFELETAGAGMVQVQGVAWVESSPMSARWGPNNSGPTFVSPSIPHDQNVQLMVHCECEVTSGASTQRVMSMTTTLQVGTTPATFTFQLLPSDRPGGYRITLRP